MAAKKAPARRNSISTMIETVKSSKEIFSGKEAKVGVCEKCGAAGDVYCVECKQSMCRFCASMIHHPTTKAEEHSLEEIDHKQPGVQIISPILLDLIVAGFLLLMFYEVSVGISQEYFSGTAFCPSLSKFRAFLARMDINVFYYFKPKMAGYCDVEDSFWRLLMDTWVRGLLTGTDSILLLAATVPAAFVYEEVVIRFLLAPAVAGFYAVLAVVVRAAERRIPSFEIADDITELETKIRRFSLARLVKAEGKPPPLTRHRRKPATDMYEKYTYKYDRIARSFNYYRGHAQAVMQTICRLIIVLCVVARVLCMCLGVSEALKWTLSRIGFANNVMSRIDMFETATGITHGESLYTDWFFMMALRAVGNQVVGSGAGVTSDILSVVGAFLSVSTTWWLLLLGVAWFFVPLKWGPLCGYFFWRKVKEQQKVYKKNWKKEGGYCEQIWGRPGCARDKSEIAASRATRMEWETRCFDREDSPMFIGIGSVPNGK